MSGQWFNKPDIKLGPMKDYMEMSWGLESPESIHSNAFFQTDLQLCFERKLCL